MSDKRNSLGSIPSSNRSLILDKIHPTDFLHLNMIYNCEQCSHFDDVSKECTIGYLAKNHMKSEQDRLYERTGRIALCRFLEID